MTKLQYVELWATVVSSFTFGWFVAGPAVEWFVRTVFYAIFKR